MVQLRRPARTDVLVDSIGELVTNDPALGDGPLGILRDAASLVVDGARRVGRAGGAAPAPPTTVVDARRRAR